MELMDKREAVEILEAGNERRVAAIYLMIRDISIAAIKKQIREKPVRVNECPACRTHMMIKHNFCPYCGQALDWQREE